jgi:hypothetical protein
MAQNIFGFQGVNTPLENLTNGRYTVADYTTLKQTTDARFKTLERQQLTPINVTMYGKVDIVPSNALPGNLSVAGMATIGGQVLVGSNLTIGGVLAFPDGSLQTTSGDGNIYYIENMNTVAGETFYPQTQTVKNYYMILMGNAACNIDLQYYFPTNFTDKTQFLTISKIMISAGDYAVTFMNLPAGYDVYLPSGVITAPLGTFTIPAGVMTWTLMQRGAPGDPYSGRYILINNV